MADIAKSKKSEKARLWEEAKLKEEEEARRKLLSLRSAEAHEIGKAGLSTEVVVPAPTDSARGDRSEELMTPKKSLKRGESVANAKLRDPPAASPVPSPVPAPAAAPATSASASSSAPASASPNTDEEVKRLRATVTRLEAEVRSLNQQLEDVKMEKQLMERNYVDARKTVDSLSRENEVLKSRDDASSKFDAERKRRMDAERTNETLMKQIEALRTQLASADPSAASTSPAVVLTPSDSPVAGEDKDEGDDKDSARLGGLTADRPAAAGKRRPTRPGRATASSAEPSTGAADRSSPSGPKTSLLAVATENKVKLEEKEERTRSPARGSELRVADIARMAANSPAHLRSAEEPRRNASPSPFSDKVRAATVQEDRLIMLKGKKRVRSKQVGMTRESLNSGDAFILETAQKIFHWNGKKSSRPERTKGVDLSHRLNRLYGSRLPVVQMDEGKTDNEDDFWAKLGGRGDIREEVAGGDDAEFEKDEEERNKLYRVTDTMELQLQQIVGGLKREDLLSENVYLLDCGDEVYLWMGKRSPADLRRDAIPVANNLLSKGTRASWTVCQKMMEDGEPPLFQEKFANWPDSFEKVMARSGGESRIARSKANEKYDASKMHAEVVRSEVRLFDDGTGDTEIFLVDKLKRGAEATKSPLLKDQYGVFWSKNSYIVVYSWGTGSAKSFILYFWQGRDCSVNEKAAAAGLILKMQEQYKGANQIRVAQQKEPAHFLLLFKSKLIIRHGDAHKAEEHANETTLFELRGTEVSNTRTVQADAQASALNSDHVFVLQTSTTQWVWAGANSSQFEKDAVKEVANLLRGSRNAESITEGSEPSAFWSDLPGGKGEYAKHFAHQVKFFQGDNARGIYTADPVPNFTADDLDSAQVELLDTFSEVYVWVGCEARDSDKKTASELAIDYVKTAPDGRSAETPILVVYEYSEPLPFTRHFQGWWPRPPRKKGSKKGVTENAPVAAAAPAAVPVSAATPAAAGGSDPTFSYEQLKLKKDLPAGLDMARLEAYLNPSEFPTVFKMTKDEFINLPAWKKLQLRKGAYLF